MTLGGLSTSLGSLPYNNLLWHLQAPLLVTPVSTSGLVGTAAGVDSPD